LESSRGRLKYWLVQARQAYNLGVPDEGQGFLNLEARKRKRTNSFPYERSNP
jgi:hypothetical protein